MAGELPVWAQRIRSRREELRLYREEIAEQLGISAKSVQRYEEGKQRPPVDRLEALATILRTSTAHLLGEVQAKSVSCSPDLLELLLQKQGRLEEGQEAIQQELRALHARLERLEGLIREWQRSA